MLKKNEKPLTLNELVKYNQKVLFPFMKENFVTKKEFEGFMEITATKEESEKIVAKLGGIATKEDVKILNKKLDSISDDLKKTNKLETRVDYIENVLAIKKI